MSAEMWTGTEVCGILKVRSLCTFLSTISSLLDSKGYNRGSRDGESRKPGHIKQSYHAGIPQGPQAWYLNAITFKGRRNPLCTQATLRAVCESMCVCC